MGIIDAYQQCLLIAPTPTKSITNAGVWAVGDIIQQLREDKLSKLKYKCACSCACSQRGLNALRAAREAGRPC